MIGLVVLVLVLVLILDKVILQQLAVAKSRSLEVAVVRMGLAMLAEIAEKKDDYNKFYEQFGQETQCCSRIDGLRPHASDQARKCWLKSAMI